MNLFKMFAISGAGMAVQRDRMSVITRQSGQHRNHAHAGGRALPPPRYYFSGGAGQR